MVGAESRVLNRMKSLDILAAIFSIVRLNDAQRAACEKVQAAEAEALVRYAYRECKGSPLGAEGLYALVARAEGSDVPLSEWVAQIVAVYRWLEEQQRSAAFADVVEYVSCACEGSALQMGHEIQWYLQQYGFQNALPR